MVDRDSRAIAVFDLDGTITRRDTFLPFLICAALRRPQRLWTLPRLAFAALKYSLGIIGNDQLKEVFIASILGGVASSNLEVWLKTFVLTRARTGLRRPAIEVLQEHIRNGDTVALATASPDLYVVPLAESLGIEHVICTRLEYENGTITGNLSGLNCYGEEKRRRVQKWLSSLPGSGQLTFYTDHHSDLPTLELADMPVVVNPARRLAAISRNRGYRSEKW